MLSKNNLNEQMRKMARRKERYSLRKLSVGVASVLIGFTLYSMGGGKFLSPS